MDSDFPRLHAFMEQHNARLETLLERFLSTDDAASPWLVRAMRYAALDGGKRIRPLLAYAACELTGESPGKADVPAAAVELIHAYSLVHDDLPAMDDDDMRRGRPTCHRAFDEATAILAGDTLHTLAFDILARRGDFPAETRLEMIRVLTGAAGVEGMAAGQTLDMLAHGQVQTLPALEEMHYLKTGRLITASLELGALAAGASDRTRDLVRRYGDRIGLAFQIHDDVLDVTGTTEELGKPRGSDHRHEKSTFPGLIGLQASEDRARELASQACELLEPLAERGQTLRQLAQFVVSRRH